MTESNTVNPTVTITKEEHKALKQAALDKDIKVSALLREWLREYPAKETARDGK